ncbi:SpoIIE family protein phosphatase [bacterium]|nr:SpoIIE family protein phosphatase [bacterium]
MNEMQRELVNATKAVLNANQTSTVIQQILLSAQTLLSAEAASVFLVNHKQKRLEMVASTNLPKAMEKSISFPLGSGVAGWVAKNNTPVVLEDISKDKRFFSAVSQRTGFRTRGYICVPLSVQEKVLGTIQVMNEHTGGNFTDQHKELLQAFAVLASLALEKNRLYSQEIEKRKLQAELKIATTFQNSLLPSSFDPPKGYQIEAYYQSARSMGGDLYDAMQVNGSYMIALGDVSGKGPGAAIWMSGFSNVLRYTIQEGHDPIDHLDHIDRHLHATLPPTSFLTLFLGMIEGDQLRYTSAGHNPMLLAHADGTHEWLEATGLPISLMPDLPRETKIARFNPGSTLVLFSDGVTEAERADGEMYEEERLLQIVKRNLTEPPDKMIRSIVRSVKGFAAGFEQSDDITLMVIKSDS